MQDTAAISTLRCLKLFLERMGAHHLDEAAAAAMAGRASKLVRALFQHGWLAGWLISCLTLLLAADSPAAPCPCPLPPARCATP